LAGARAFLKGVGAKGAQKLGVNTAKTIENAGPGVLKTLTNWWDGGMKQAAKEAQEFAGKSSQEMIQALDPGLLSRVSSETATRLNASLASARQKMAETAVRLSEELTRIPGAPRLLPGVSMSEANAAKQTIKNTANSVAKQLDEVKNKAGALEEQMEHMVGENSKDAVQMATFMRSELNSLASKQVKLENQLVGLEHAKKIVGKLSHVSELDNLLIQKKYDEILKRMYSYDPNISKWTSDLMGHDVAAQVEAARHSLSAASKNLNKPKALLQEYLDMINRGDKVNADAFRTNPHNASVLLDITKRRPDLMAQVTKGEITRVPLRQSLVGLTRGDTVKRLGLGAAGLTATGFGAVKAFDWFGKNDPAQTAKDSTLVRGSISSLRVKEPGASVLRSAQNAVTRIGEIANNTNTQLAQETTSASAAGNFVTGISSELSILVKALEQWDLVEQNAEDPQQAREVGEDLAEFANGIASSLGELNTQVASGSDSNPSVGSENLSKIQGFLNIPVTGKLDEPTATGLKNLEKQFNAKTNDTAFTGALIKNDGSVISYDNLIKAYQKLQNY